MTSVVGWANEEIGNLRWRVDVIRTGQSLESGRGIPDWYVAEAHDRALIAAFVPSRFDLERVYDAWVVAKAATAGRKLGRRYLAGEEISIDLYAPRHRAGYESLAAEFFNAIGDESTAYLPSNLDSQAWQGTMTEDEAAAALQRYAHAFAAATRSGAMQFTVEEFFTRDDPLAEINDKYAAALLMTEPGIAAEWLEPAAQRIIIGEPYVSWITSPGAVAAVIRGLANNPDIAARILTQPRAVDYLMRRSSLVEGQIATQIGAMLVIAATAPNDTGAATQVAAATIAAIGSGNVHPHDEVLPYAAVVGGTFIDELAYSLADSVADPTYSPRFEVSRATARVFIREVVRNTEGYASMLAATQVWVRRIIAPPAVTTFDDYTTRVQNKTDDIGRLLGTIISADEMIAVADAEERARRKAMLLDAAKTLGQLGAEFTGPASMVLQPSVEFLRNRADDLLKNVYVRDAYYDNQRFQEAILDELDEALYEVIRNLGLTDAGGELDRDEIELREGAVRSLLRSLIAAELLAYSSGDIRADSG